MGSVWCVATKETRKANVDEEAWLFQVGKAVSAGRSQCLCETPCVCVCELPKPPACFRSPELGELRQQ